MTNSSFILHTDTQAYIDELRRDKYMQPGELDWSNTHSRVASYIFKDDFENQNRFFNYLDQRLACPGGRIMAGAGTGHNVVLFNCFIAPLLQDSMKTMPGVPGKGIMDALSDVAYSMQMGGGVGTDFSPLRPEGALVERIMSPASGPLAFMDMWDAMCRTVMSAGYRRGAMMATLVCDHPDIHKFITAKHNPTRLRMFNVSVLVTDAFMRAVEAGAEWDLGHWIRPFDNGHMVRETIRYDHREKCERPWFVYQVVDARELWAEIMLSTYKYAEPGVIFIDRVNFWNNLHYCEYISCVNPCAEQPMSPDSSCNLAHENLSRMVIDPYGVCATVDYQLVDDVTRLLVRANDRIIDLSQTATGGQALLSQQQRRIGLGITGYGNMLMFLGQRYGSKDALHTAGTVMEVVREAAYQESALLAKEHGSFPLFDRDKYLAGEFVKTLTPQTREMIAEYGMRNSHLLTIAPVGTGSQTQCDNSSSGLEPVFMPVHKRKVLQPDGSYKESVIEDFGWRVYANVKFDGDMDAALAAPRPDYMVSVPDLTVEDHLVTLAEFQQYIDSSISKTINMPEDTPFEDFKAVYSRAYALGCKSCTTYRPDPTSGRGEVLSAVEPKLIEPQETRSGSSPSASTTLRPRPDMLEGRTYRLRWANLPYPLYLTINDEVMPDGRHVPFECFINSKSVDAHHWVTAFTRLVTSIMRSVPDFRFLPDELKQVWSARGGEIKGRRFIPSEIALIGQTLEEHFIHVGYIDKPTPGVTTEELRITGNAYAELGIGGECPKCGALQLIHSEGCETCLACDYQKCG